MENLYRIVIEREDDVYMASTIGKRVAEEYGLNKSQQTKLVVSIMELTRNIVYMLKKENFSLSPFLHMELKSLPLIKVLALQILMKYLNNTVPFKNRARIRPIWSKTLNG